MASNEIKLKRSSVQSKVPSISDLTLGELSVNTFDGKLFFKKNNMNVKDIKLQIIRAGEKAVVQLIKVAEEQIIKYGEDDELAADKLKNAAATKKLAIFDAFEILSRIEAEKSMIEDSESPTKDMNSFAERRAK